MPPDSHSKNVRPSAFLTRAAFQLVAAQRCVLLRPGSLSSRLQRWCHGALPVTVVRQGRGLPSPDEARLLGLRSREWVWIREVQLGPPHQPWVKARTVSPLKALHGPLHFLRNLGTRPLGSVLFSGPAWRRSRFLTGVMEATDPVASLPARRSMFFHRDARLLVTEGFYPAFWRRLEHEEGSARQSSPAGALDTDLLSEAS